MMDKAYIEAIDRLILYYSEFPPGSVPPNLLGCPLCEVDKKFNDNCSSCPWVIIEGMVPAVNSQAPCIKGGYYKQTTARRLERLNRWKNEKRV
jgi:hypothetical protein